MLHVLGFGTLWAGGPPGDLVGSPGGSDPFFSGVEGRAAFRDFNGGAAYGGTPVPVDGTGATGTRNGHWRASVFAAELMTPSVSGPTAPVSRTTLESLADLGWQVNGSLADPFEIASVLASPLSAPEPALDPVDLAGDLLAFAPLRRGSDALFR
jgi:hypothetical protein